MKNNTASFIINLQEVDWAILHWLLCYPFQRVEDIALMLHLTRSSVYHHLNKLLHYGCVEAITPPSLEVHVSCRLYHLGNIGLHLLAQRMQKDPARLAHEWQTDQAGLQRLLPRLHSLTILHTCISSLFAYAPSAHLTKQGRRSPIRWHWLRDYQHRFLYREHSQSCSADAVLAWNAYDGVGEHDKEQWFSLCLLLDTGLSDTTLIRDRLRQLLYLRESAERWSVYHHFPVVLVLVPRIHQAEHWQRRMRELAIMMHVDGLVGAILAFPPMLKRKHGNITNIWTLSCQQLSTNAPCRLHDVLQPCPHEALLPKIQDHIQKTKLHANTYHTFSTLEVARSQKRIIKGDFPARATQQHDKEVVLDSLRLGQRHISVLTLLINHALLTKQEIAALLNVQEESANRYLRTLQSEGYLTVWQQIGETPRWYLTAKGLRILAAFHHVHILRLGSYRTQDEQKSVPMKELIPKDVDMLQRYPKHLAGIYSFLAALHTAAYKNGYTVMWWETGAQCERSYSYQEKLHNLRPDAEFEFTAETKRVRAWLEWDGGTMSRRDLEAKMNAYSHYVRSREWHREGAHTLPILLFVVPDKGQEERVVQAVVKALANRTRCVHDNRDTST